MVSFQVIPSAFGMVFVLGLISASSIRIEMTKKTIQVNGDIQESVVGLLGRVQMALNPKWNSSTESLNENFHCSCGGSHCRCCRIIRVSYYPSYCCVLVEYRHHLDSLEFSLEIGHRQLFHREIHLRHHPPVCTRLSSAIVCLGLNDVRIWGHRDHSCPVVTVSSHYYRHSYQMGCFTLIYNDQEDGPARPSGPVNSGAETQMFLPDDWIEDGDAGSVPGGSDLNEEQP